MSWSPDYLTLSRMERQGSQAYVHWGTQAQNRMGVIFTLAGLQTESFGVWTNLNLTLAPGWSPHPRCMVYMPHT